MQSPLRQSVCASTATSQLPVLQLPALQASEPPSPSAAAHSQRLPQVGLQQAQTLHATFRLQAGPSAAALPNHDANPQWPHLCSAIQVSAIHARSPLAILQGQLRLHDATFPHGSYCPMTGTSATAPRQAAAQHNNYTEVSSDHKHMQEALWASKDYNPLHTQAGRPN